MTGKADYRNRAALLGSMLEQISEDYIFVYSRGYPMVAVKQGRFPSMNDHQIRWEDTNWQLIDLTSPGLASGRTFRRASARGEVRSETSPEQFDNKPGHGVSEIQLTIVYVFTTQLD